MTMVHIKPGFLYQDGEWKESEHPRVQGGEHGGEFTSGGGGGSTKNYGKGTIEPPQGGLHVLTERHKDIIEWHKRGMRPAQIASKLNLAKVPAVRRQFRAILRKAGVYKERGGLERVAKVEVPLLPPHQVEAHLLNTPITSQSGIGGGHINDVFLINFKDGSKGVFKPNSGEYSGARHNITDGYLTEREVGAWEVAKLAGLSDLVAPAVVKDINGERGALLDFQAGKMAVDAKNAYDGRENAARAAAFDFVIGNTDRHKGNWLVEGDKLHLIDHGLAFPDKGEYDRGFNEAFLKYISKQQAQGFAGIHHEKVLLPNEVAKPFVENKGKILDRLKDLGLPKGSIDGVSRRIDILAKGRNWDTLQDANL